MKKYLMPIYVALFLLGATALWYFGHHRPAQKILEAEPKRVYKSTPLQPESLPVTSTPSNATQQASEGDIGMAVEAIDTESEDTESEDMDNTATPEKIDNSQEHSEDSGSDALMSQEALSSEEVAALKAYEEVQSEYLAAQDILQAALEARPIDWERVRSANNNFKNAARHRKEALQNLAPYSEDAAKLLEEMKEAEKRSDEMRAEFDSETRSYENELHNLKDILEKSQ